MPSRIPSCLHVLRDCDRSSTLAPHETVLSRCAGRTVNCTPFCTRSRRQHIETDPFRNYDTMIYSMLHRHSRAAEQQVVSGQIDDLIDPVPDSGMPDFVVSVRWNVLQSDREDARTEKGRQRRGGGLMSTSIGKPHHRRCLGALTSGSTFTAWTRRSKVPAASNHCRRQGSLDQALRREKSAVHAYRPAGAPVPPRVVLARAPS